jgi:hypothetical protein
VYAKEEEMPLVIYETTSCKAMAWMKALFPPNTQSKEFG